MVGASPDRAIYHEHTPQSAIEQRTEFYGVGREMIDNGILLRVRGWPIESRQGRTLITFKSFSGPLTPRIDSLCNSWTGNNQQGN